jgi:hypothetical protein
VYARSGHRSADEAIDEGRLPGSRLTKEGDTDPRLIHGQKLPFHALYLVDD